MNKSYFYLPFILVVLLLTACQQQGNEQNVSNTSTKDKEKKTMHIAMLLPGKIDDEGFMESGYDGLKKIKEDLNAEISYKANIKPEEKEMKSALEDLAKEKPNMIIAHGGQASEAVENIAKEYPNIEFVVTQGHVKGKNLSSYEVLQEESAYLAGAAAGLLTKSGTVGHMSGIRVVPGLKGRAAFADGLKKTNPNAKLLTSFIGDQDSVDLSRKYADAQANAGADIIFTMLNSGRQGVTDVLGKLGLKEIGNVKDYVKIEPDIFIGSAVADSGMAGYLAAERLIKGNYKPNVIERMGLENEVAVRLSLSNKVPSEVKQKIDKLAEQLKDGSIEIKTEYNGPEFEL